MARSSRPRRTQYGGVLISGLAFAAISAFIVVGMLTMTVANYARSSTEADYESALSLAEAGVNYELRKITLNTANADQRDTAPSYTFGNGTFKVYCTNKD